MKKENLIAILVYLLVFAVAIIYGFTILQAHYNDSAFNEIWKYALYILVSVFLGVIATATFQEFGHFLGAKVGGYKIRSFNMLYFNIYKDNEKTKFRFASYDGLTGETKIVPNYEKKERPNPYPFLIYGSVFNLSWVIVCVFLFFTYHKEIGIVGDAAYLFLTMGIIAFMSMVYNILPMKMDAKTDGYQLKKMGKDVEGFNSLLTFEESGKEGIEKIKEDKPAKFIPEMAVDGLSHLLVEKKYDEVFETIKKIKEEETKLSDRLVLETKAQYIYASLLTLNEVEVASFYDNDVSFALRRELAAENNLPVIRTYIYIAGVLDGSLSECLLSAKKVVKALKGIPTNRKHDEIILFNETLDLVTKKHPKWDELMNYKIVE